jgi:hypothetical protein
LKTYCGAEIPFGGVVSCGSVAPVTRFTGSSRVVRLNFGGDQVS